MAGGFLNLVYGLLDGLRVIGETVAVNGESVVRQIDRLRIVQTDGIIGRSGQASGRGKGCEENGGKFLSSHSSH
ncbi:MAG TPA: hypothetical protein VLW65_14430 [Bryobacteraceae bacterium]|nr:hypothetical protein [Bryobacteraceae bacterium]